MAAFGSFALLIALALAAYNLVAGAVALRLIATGQKTAILPERLADTARRAGLAGFYAVTAAALALVWSVFANDFSLTYIVEHSNRALPGWYKFSALWSGQEGSLLLWAWLLAGYGFVLRLTHKRDVKLYAYAGAILAGIQFFFLLVLNISAPPFAIMQVAAGARCIQVFDSWIGALGADDYVRYVAPYSRALIERIRSRGVPVIHFGTGCAGYFRELHAAGGDVMGVDWRLNIDQAWMDISYRSAIQGNMDPAALFAPLPEIKQKVTELLKRTGTRPGHIFNVGHGILPDTPVESVKAVVQMVREFRP